MGFCLINHVAIAAADLLAASITARIAIVDVDVHHGNGTQDIFIADPRVFYASTHQFPHYPGTGRVDELGVGDAVGFNCNLPLPAGCGDEEYLRCFDEVILPAVRRFRAQFLFVSAGFDAHWRDPLAAQQISGRGYRPIAERLRGLAQELGMPTLYMLEGGYDLEAVAWAVREVPAVGHGHHKVLMEGCQLAVATAPAESVDAVAWAETIDVRSGLNSRASGLSFTREAVASASPPFRSRS